MEWAGRRGFAHWSAAVLLLVTVACAGPGPADRQGRRPEIHSGTAQSGATWTLSGARAVHEIVLPLDPQHFLDVAIHQRGLDVVSHLVDPDGRQVVVVDTATGSHSVEEVRVITDKAGEHRLRLELSGPPDGSVEVVIRAYRPADSRDRRRAAAADLVARGHLAWIADELVVTEEVFRRAIPLLEEVGEGERAAGARHLLGLALEGQGRLKEAARELERATEEYRRRGRAADEALALNQLGRVLRPLGRPEAAEATYRRALEVARREGLQSVEAAALQNLGLVAEQRGHLEEALDLYERALEVRRTVGPPAETALVLRRLGSLYSLIGRDSDGLVLLEEALEQTRQDGSPEQEARALDALAWARHQAGDPVKALADFDAALQLARKLDHPDLTLDLLARRASVLRALGETERARSDYRRVLRHRRESGEVTGQGYARANLGWLALDGGDLGGAREHLAAAVQLLEGRDQGEGWYSAHLGLGKLERQAGRTQEAQRHLETAIATLEAMRGPLMSWLSRGYLLGTRFEAYEELVGLRMDLHRDDPEAGHDLRALEVAERARVRSLLEHLAAETAPVPAEAPLELGEIRRLEMERLELQRTAPDSPRLEALDEELRRLWLRAERSPGLAAPDAAEVRALDSRAMQELLDPDTLFLVFSLGEPNSFAWVVGRADVHSFRLPGRRTLSTLAGRVVRATAEGGDSVGQARARRLAAELSRLLLEPVAPVLVGQRLVLVLDGALHQVPFAALPLPGEGRGGGVLIDRFELVTVPSPSVLSLQRDRLAAAHGGRGAVVLADPVYEPTDPRLGGDGGGQVPADLQRSIDDFDLSRLIRLPHTGDEVEALLSRLPPGSVLVARDFAAHPDLLLETDLSRFPILHLAAHGLIHPVHPELSGVVLSLVDEDGRPRDGFLRAHQVARLHLPVELVVLSACRTALGHEVRGEAPLGLVQAFFRAGSRRVLASNWNVGDRGTAELMDRFYAALLDQGLPPGAALRQAQLELRRSDSWSQPHHWAAFHLQGDWRGDLSQQETD